MSHGCEQMSSCLFCYSVAHLLEGPFKNKTQVINAFGDCIPD